MVAPADYAGREQSYVKHVFLERYLEVLIFKTASVYNHIVYVDGFAGPWQSANEKFEDTSFGIALNALRRAKEMCKNSSGNMRMTAFLVEQHPKGYAHLSTIQPRFPDIEIKTYPDDFISVVPRIVADIPRRAFAFLFIDPKGWGIPLLKLQPMLARPKSEVTFNFMFEFVNRAANMTAPDTVAALDELMPYGKWRARLAEAEKGGGRQPTPEDRNDILISAFTENLQQIGDYQYAVDGEFRMSQANLLQLGPGLRELRFIVDTKQHGASVTLVRQRRGLKLERYRKSDCGHGLRGIQEIAGQHAPLGLGFQAWRYTLCSRIR
jgi:three-Cys-motif partner protein